MNPRVFPPNDPRRALAEGPLLLYDGECGVCAGSVQWLLAREATSRPNETKQLVRFVPLQSDLGRSLREFAKIPSTVDSVLWMELSGETLVAERYSNAVLRVLSYLGGVHRWGLLLRLVPRFVRDVGYRLFARFRLRVASPRCLVPTPEERRRFLTGSLDEATAGSR